MNFRVDWKLLSILIIGIFARLSPLFLTGFIDPDSYYHLRLITAIDSFGKLISYDPLSFGGRPYTYYPLFHLMGFNLFSLWGIGNFASFSILSLLATLVAILATYSLTKKIVDLTIQSNLKEYDFFKNYSPYLASLLIAISPAALSRSMVFGRPDAFVLCFAPLILLSYLNKENFNLFLLFFLLTLIHLPSALVLFATLVAIQISSYLVKAKTDSAPLLYGFFGLILSSIYYLQFNVLNYLSPAIFSSSELSIFSWQFIFFYTIAPLVFVFIFIYFAFKENFYSKISVILFWFSISVALLIVGQRNIVFLAPSLCILCGLSIGLLISKLTITKELMLISISLFFAVILLSYSSTIFQQSSNSDFSSAFYLSNSISGPAGLVASTWDQGHLLTYLSARPVYVDGYFEFSNNAIGRIQLTNLLFYGLSEQSFSSLNQLFLSNVKYIFATSQQHNSDVNYLENSSNESVSKIYDSGSAVYYIQKSGN